MIKEKKDFYDLGADHFDKQKKQPILKRTVKRLESLGYKVTIQEDGNNTA